jgi:hypothetical protein
VSQELVHKGPAQLRVTGTRVSRAIVGYCENAGGAKMADDFDKLQQQYFEATYDERERLWPDFIRAIREAYPGLVEEFEQAFSSGDALMSMFGQCMERVLARPDLSAGRKTNAQEDAAGFYWVFDELKQVDSGVRALAFELATRALFTGLRVGLSPSEVEVFRAQFRTEDQRMRGVKSGESRRAKDWRKFAKDAALRIHEANPGLTLTDIARNIIEEWKSEKFEKVEEQQLFKYLSDRVDHGELPSSMKKPARNTKSSETE